jgi:hypothetical protein
MSEKESIEIKELKKQLKKALERNVLLDSLVAKAFIEGCQTTHYKSKDPNVVVYDYKKWWEESDFRKDWAKRLAEIK